MRVLETHIDIDTTPERVWAVLTDFEAFEQWNPFITTAVGALMVGERLEITIRPPGARAMTFKPTVTANEPNRHLAWLGRLGFAHVFDGAHEFTVEANGHGGTSFTQRETFRGVLVPFLARTLTHTLHGFELMNNALKQRAESLTVASR